MNHIHDNIVYEVDTIGVGYMHLRLTDEQKLVQQTIKNLLRKN